MTVTLPSHHPTQALSRPLEASLVYGTGVRRDTTRDTTGTGAGTALGHTSGAREVWPQDTCYLSAGGGGAGGGGGVSGAASDTARRHAANFDCGARRGGSVALARGAAARGGAAAEVAAARCGEKLAGAVRSAERAEVRMGRGAAWEGREAGVLPAATAEAAAAASRAAHVAVFGGDGGGGRSSVARERYEIMYGRALQPPGGALPWKPEKVSARDRSARAEHEKKYSTNMFDHTR